MKYKINWMENKKRKIEGDLNKQKNTKIEQMKKKLKLNAATEEEDES